jgi:hypothetical protein
MVDVWPANIPYHSPYQNVIGGMTMKKNELEMHVRVVGWLYILSNSILLLMGLTGLVFLTGLGVVSGDVESTSVLGFIGGVGLLFLAALALPGMLAGYGLLKRTPWARVLALVVAVLGLVNFPIGTAIGIYAFWVMLREDAAEYFVTPKIA